MNKKNFILELESLYKNKKYDELRENANIYINMFNLILTDEEYFLANFYTLCNNIEDLENFSKTHGLSKEIKELTINQIKNYYLKETASNIPKLIHLIYLKQRPLNSYNYKCINSVIKHMSDYKIIIHNDIEPNDSEWEILKTNKNVSIHKVDRIKKYKDIQINHIQYESDIIRLQILYEFGGVYLDTDIYILKNFDELIKDYNVFYCQENPGSLINCVLCSEPKNEFINILMSNLEIGLRMNSWAWHIRDFPKLLLNNNSYFIYKYKIKILDHKNFCPIKWTEDYLLNDPNFIITDDMYGVHLFETILGDKLNNCYLINTY